MIKINNEYAVITEIDFINSIDCYFKWKTCNENLKLLNGRQLIFPECISETIGCYLLNFQRNLKRSGDATDTKTNKKIEFKACSTESDLSTFGPNEYFDKLYFLHYNLNDDVVEIFDMRMSYKQMGRLKASKKNNIKDLRSAGKRPHYSLIENIIKPKKLRPIMTLDLRTQRVKKELVF